MSNHEQPAITGPKEPSLDQLRQVPMLASLTEAQLGCLEGLETIEFAPGQLLAVQGETARYFWILLEGKVQLSQTSGDGEKVDLIAFSSGAAFGEVPLLANIPNPASVRAAEPSTVLRFDSEGFWKLMTICPEVRGAILRNMASRFQKMHSWNARQEKLAALGTLAAGLMHELNNPGAAAGRAASQLRANLFRMHELSAKFNTSGLTPEQKGCLLQLQGQVLSPKPAVHMNSLEQSDAEEAMCEWMERAGVEDAWKLTPAFVSAGIEASELGKVKQCFSGKPLGDALSWIEATASSLHLLNAIEESIGRVSDLVRAVKTYAYEGKGQGQTIDINESIHATLVILAHKLREKEITVQKELATDLPPMAGDCTGLNQIWTNLLDNAIDALPSHGAISLKTWAERPASGDGAKPSAVCIRITDNGSGIPPEVQPQIFDPFFTTKQSGAGTGLGLDIVHRIVEHCGGTISFRSQPGETEFIVRLPLRTS